MGVTKEIWVDYITEALYKDNRFLEVSATNDDSFVKEGTIVHKPQQNGRAEVVRNRSSLPATVVKRNDTATVYLLDEFSTTPTLIPNIEQYELSYDKMASVLGDHIGVLREDIADWLIYKWLATFARTGSATTPAAPVIRTSGAAVAGHVGTGNRKLFVKEDLKAARLQMNKDNVPITERFALMSSDLIDQLTNDSDLKVRDNALELDMRSGTIGRLYGFEILERSSTALYTNAATPVVKEPGAAGAGTDNDAVVCYQKGAVARAIGTIDLFESLNDPMYYGDIYSAIIMAGGQKQREDGKGIIAIVQDASA